MNKTSRKLIIWLLLTILTISSVYASLIPNAQAAEITTRQKGLTIINRAAGFNLQAYNISVTDYPSSEQASIAPDAQGTVVYNLKSQGSAVKVHCTFLGDNLRILHVLENEGTPILAKSAIDSVHMAKDFLRSYQSLTGKALYGQLSAALNDIDETKNSTTTAHNFKLDVTNNDDSQTYRWSYFLNGISAPSKCVSLAYKDGNLEYFVDNWDIYPVGSVKVNVLEEQAVSIALEKAKAYTWMVGLDNKTVKINNFNITGAMEKRLIFVDSTNADYKRTPNTLYPVWRIGVGLDKYYPGDVVGIYVDIWADTGQVRYTGAVVSAAPSLDPSTVASIEDSTKAIDTLSSNTMSKNSADSLYLIYIALVIVISPLVVLKVQKKAVIKLSSVLLCSLMVLSLAATAPTADAYLRRATIWGSLAQDKLQSEISKQTDVCSYISELFGNNGYVTTNYQGANSVRDTALNAILTDELNSDYIATVWFDHGIGHLWDFPGVQDEWHFRLCDSDSNPDTEYLYWQSRYIYDFEIYDRTQYAGKTFFAYISTCMSARLTINDQNGNPLGPGGTGTYGPNPNGAKKIGMPYAWTHGASLSYDGYNAPDSGDYCYIGFPWGSPSLDQCTEYDYPNTNYKTWVDWFFIYALNPDFSIRQALDQASLHCFGRSFGSTYLRNEFAADWWPSSPQSGCTMAVYGNGNIRLKNYNPTVDTVGRPTTFGPVNGNPYETYYFTTSASDSQGHNIRYTFNWGDGTYTTTGYYPSGQDVTESHYWTSGGEKTVTVTAECQNGAYSTGPSYNTIYIGNWDWLYLDAKETTYWSTPSVAFYVDGQYICSGWGQVYLPEGYHTVQVDPEEIFWESGWIYFQYMCDGVNYYSNPAQVNMNGGWRAVTAYYAWG